MPQQSIRRSAVAGSWYSSNPAILTREVDQYLERATGMPHGDVRALVAPHAGFVYSGAVAACAYRCVVGCTYDVAVLVGPSHYVGFEGVSIWEGGTFETPLGPVLVSASHAAALLAASPLVHVYPPAHAREHSLEMHLPFVRRVLADTPIVPLVMGFQDRRTILGLADALARTLADSRVLLIASTDLSHYFDADRAIALDGRVIEHVRRFDPDGLLQEFERYPEGERGRCVACGGGPAITVMRAAKALGAREAVVLKYANSGDVSGDRGAVVGYLAVAMGTFSDERRVTSGGWRC